MELNINKDLTLTSKCKDLHFDVSQTDGKPLPTLAQNLTASVQNYEVTEVTHMVQLRIAAQRHSHFQRKCPKGLGCFPTSLHEKCYERSHAPLATIVKEAKTA